MPVNKVARRKPALPVVPDDSFDSLRKLFTSREAGESASLATLQEKLHATLMHAQQEIDRTLDEIRTRTHRLHGAAAILGFAELAAVANTLEQATAAAAGLQERRVNTRVSQTLKILIQLLRQHTSSVPFSTPPSSAPSQERVAMRAGTIARPWSQQARGRSPHNGTKATGRCSRTGANPALQRATVSCEPMLGS
jgi:HPt (histidine-containing phosphotransfer) domain-containing protein